MTLEAVGRAHPLARFARTAFFAPSVYALCDFVFSWNPLASRPYLTHRHEAVFRVSPALHFGVLAEIINGTLATCAFAAVFASQSWSPAKRGALFGLLLWAFWVVSGTMSTAVWLDVPTSVLVTNVIFGLPKSLAIGCAVAWLWGRS